MRFETALDILLMASEFWGFGLWRFFLLSVCVEVGDASRYSAPRYPGRYSSSLWPQIKAIFINCVYF